ncbi:hypothetical protein AB0L53_19765 [Nonomuraea sp. NPDC052129]|uniref:hypothetical protein n=1 Tax=Nonomuraea sp. NPDC052129 TaxID=3154651 RepID=UPI003423FA11
MLDELGLNDEAKALVPHGQPHRALWDAVSAALLLGELVSHLPDKADTTLATLIRVAGRPLRPEPDGADQLTLDP